MKISIIIPTTNQHDHINEVVKKVIHPEIEIIVVGKGTYSGCRIIESDSKSINNLRKLGVQKAIGKYIYLIDRDDELLLKADEIISCLKADIIIFPVLRQGKIIKKYSTIEEAKEKNWTFWNIIAKEELYKNVLFPDLKNTQDLVPVQMLLHSSDNIHISDKVIYEYKISDTSIQSKLTNLSEGVNAIETLLDNGIVNKNAMGVVMKSVLIKSLVHSKSEFNKNKIYYSKLRKKKMISLSTFSIPMPYCVRKFIIIQALKRRGLYRWKK